MALRILVVDDHAATRRGILSILAKRVDWNVCGEATDGIEAIARAKELRPDAILMDVSMPHMDGLQAARELRRYLPTVKIVIVSENEPSVVRQQAHQVHADAYVEKNRLAQHLIPSISTLFPEATPESKPEAIPDHANPTDNSRERVAGWLEGGGEMGELIRKTDWTQTPLGATTSWSPALRMIVKFLLANRFPQLLWWGPEFCSVYNDAYIPILGTKHPWALGRPVREVWNEIWHVLKPLIETPFSGGPATWMEDIPLEINRRGFLEETHFTIAYSPVPDESVPGAIGGVLATVHEITEKVVGERRVRALRDLGARSVEPKSAGEACIIVRETLSLHPRDIPFLLLYLLDEKQENARLVCCVGAEEGDRGCPELLELSLRAEDKAWPLSEVLATEDIQLVENLDGKFGRVPRGPWSDAPTRAAVVPIRSNLQHHLAGFMVVGLSSRLEFDKSYRDFLELMSVQIATTVANARAYEEERKRAEALAEIDRAKTLFFSNVSHEFRTPLTLMLGPLEDTLARGRDLPEKHRNNLEVAHRNSLRLLKLVNALLDFSRIEAGRVQACYEPVDLASLTVELAGLFRSAIERAGLRLLVNCDLSADVAYVDREMWEKIVFNLLSNAFKFTFNGEIEVSLKKIENAAELQVRDTGTGIPVDDLPHLFERFYRVQGARGRTWEGSGIGLALVQELAKLHSGSVRVESELGRGSTFIVTVPLGKDHLPTERIGAARTLGSTGISAEAYVQEALHWSATAPDVSDDIEIASLVSTRAALSPENNLEEVSRVLFADDNADMRQYLTTLLNPQYEVVPCEDGQVALEQARQRRPDLVLADVMMPRMDGFSLLRALREDKDLRDIPVILLSARAGEESRIEGLDAGADDYLVKPFSARELIARVGSHLAMAKARREAEQALRDSEERFRALVNATSYVVYRMNPDWSEMRQLEGRGFVSDTGRPKTDWLEEYIHANDRELVLRTIREAARTKSMFQLEHRVRRTDGSMGWTYSRAVPLFDNNGEIIEWFGAASDITARKDAEEKYRQLAQTLDAEVRARTRDLEERNTEMSRQSDHVRELSWRLLRAQDEERRHIARELHDSAGQTLTVLGMDLAQLVQKTGRTAPELAIEAERIQEMVQQLHRDIRTTSYLLHPPLLDENGLYSALSWYIDGLGERSSLEIKLDISQEFGRLPREMELVVFRLVQECLTNIHRHSGSKTANIRIAREEGLIAVEIQDHGQGMSAQRLTEVQSGSSGVGIRGMRERLGQFKAELKIESGSTGTRILVSIPVSKSTTAENEAAAESLPTVV
jgi:signal transduction histidine kinase/DNA-binding response OmpR family regulator